MVPIILAINNFFKGNKMAAPVIVIALIATCMIAIPISGKFLGKNNAIEEASEEILEKSSKIFIDSLDGELGNEEEAVDNKKATS